MVYISCTLNTLFCFININLLLYIYLHTFKINCLIPFELINFFFFNMEFLDYFFFLLVRFSACNNLSNYLNISYNMYTLLTLKTSSSF